jgi:hypothetical protein
LNAGILLEIAWLWGDAALGDCYQLSSCNAADQLCSVAAGAKIVLLRRLEALGCCDKRRGCRMDPQGQQVIGG